MTDTPSKGPGISEVYFEFSRIGTALKVTAIDAKSGVEVSVVGTTAYPQHYMEGLALKKLRKRLLDLQEK